LEESCAPSLPLTVQPFSSKLGTAILGLDGSSPSSFLSDTCGLACVEYGGDFVLRAMMEVQFNDLGFHGVVHGMSSAGKSGRTNSS
jgi:hypothetical protein